MMNVMEVKGYKAVVQYDPEIDMFRGEFTDLHGGADFYAKDIKSLHKEAETSLKVFLDMCKEDGVKPHKQFSGKFNLRMPPKLHADIVTAAVAEGQSLNQWVINNLSHITEANLRTRTGSTPR